MSTITEKVKASTDADIQRLASRVVELEGELQCAQRSRAGAMLEIKRLREALEAIGETGTVYVYPDRWNSAKEGGSPEINDFYEVDLYSIVKEALANYQQ